MSANVRRRTPHRYALSFERSFEDWSELRRESGLHLHNRPDAFGPLGMNRRRMRERRRANGPPSLEAISVEASYSYCICWSFTSFALFHQRGKRVRFVVELECLDDGDDHLSTGGSRIRRVHTLKETSEDALDEHLRELRLRWRNRSSPTELLVSVRKSCR